MDSHARSIAKTFTWRGIATLITMSVAWLILGDMGHASGIALLDMVVKFIAYYGHERIWDRVALGRAKPPEYTI